jgi:hypothetical protein
MAKDKQIVHFCKTCKDTQWVWVVTFISQMMLTLSFVLTERVQYHYTCHCIVDE